MGWFKSRRSDNRPPESFAYEKYYDDDDEYQRRDGPGKTTRLARFFRKWLLRSQVWSVIQGLFYIAVHVGILVHDMNTPELKAYLETYWWGTGDPDAELPSASTWSFNELCSYFPNTSIPNQGHGSEPFLYFGFHETGIIFLSILLIIDETTNVRFGILGPQESKGGAAWTCFYLFTATMSRSFAFSSKGVTLFVTYACFAFLCISVYNILYAITGRLIDHGPGWSGYRSSAMIRYEDEWAAETDKERRNQINPFNVGGRTALGPRGKMFRLSRWLRDSSIWADEENGQVKGVNKKIIRGVPVRYRDSPSASMYLTIDLRRWCSQTAGLSMLLLHVSLFLKDVQWKQRMSYIAQYAAIKSTWDGLSTFGKGMPTGCAYYDQSSVPIRMYLDASDRSSATTNTALFGLNQAFLVMFSLSVALVSITNQKEYGNIGFGISLIGPRMSSVGIGWMLLHLCFATFSQSLFPDTLWLYYVCKGIIYYTGIIGITNLVFAESLTLEDHRHEKFGARNPFYGGFFNFRSFERSDAPFTPVRVVPEKK